MLLEVCDLGGEFQQNREVNASVAVAVSRLLAPGALVNRRAGKPPAAEHASVGSTQGLRRKRARHKSEIARREVKRTKQGHSTRTGPQRVPGVTALV